MATFPTLIQTLMAITHLYVTLYHKPLIKSAPDQFGFIANLETLCCELKNDVSFDFTQHRSEVKVLFPDYVWMHGGSAENFRFWLFCIYLITN